MRERTVKPSFLAAVLLTVGALGTAFTQEKRRVERVEYGTEASAGSGRWALIVGVDEYQSGDIERLSGAVSDAKAVREALVKYAEFPEGQVFLLTSDLAAKPTARSILANLEKIRESTQRDDLVLFFFAGHGVELAGQRYLLTHDADISSAADLKATALLATTLMQELETIPAAHRVVMIDACRNDPTKGSRKANIASEAFEAAFTLQPANEGGVRATLLSCSKGQSAYEWTEKGHGFFSFHIEKGLSGEASIRGRVTLTSLIDYLNETVPQAVRQHRNRDQTPYAKFEGPSFILVRPERISKEVRDGLPTPPAMRTLYGVAKNSEGVALKGAAIAISLPRGTGGARGARGGGPGNAPAPREIRVTTDEDGFFKAEGVPAAAEAQVTAALVGYMPKTVSAPPSESGKKINLFLARDAPPPSPGAVGPDGKVAAAVPGSTDPQNRARELANVAYLTLLSEDFKEAERSARLALEADPENALANAVLGNAMMAGAQTSHTRKTSAAREAIDKALSRDRNLALAHNALGLTLLAGENLQGALTAFLTATQLDGKLGVAYANLGQAHRQRKQLTEAELAYKQAATLIPESATPYNGLSLVLHGMGRYGDAEKACRSAISRYQLRDQHLASFYVQLARSLYEQRSQSPWKQEQALEGVARAKSLGLTEHPAYAVIESPQEKQKETKPTVQSATACCSIVPNPALKGRFGRLVVTYPEEAVPDTYVHVFKPGNKEAITYGRGNSTLDLLPGTYAVVISDKRVEGVTVKTGHDTRVRVGVLRVKAPDSVYVGVLDPATKKQLTYGRGEHLHGLLAGTYIVSVQGQTEEVTIQDGKITDY